MSTPGPWETPAIAAGYVDPFPRVPGRNGRVTFGPNTQPEYIVETRTDSRAYAVDTNGQTLTFTSYTHNAADDFYYSPREGRFATRPTGFFAGVVVEYLERWPLAASPATVLGVDQPDGVVGYEWEEEGWVDYLIDFGPWSVPPSPNYAQVIPQHEDRTWAQTDASGLAEDIPSANFTFAVVTLDEAAMNLTDQSSPAAPDRFVGNGPAPWTLPQLMTETVFIPSRPTELDPAARTYLSIPPLSVRPANGAWLCIGAWSDWWTGNKWEEWERTVDTRASFDVDVFAQYRDPLPRYRWLYPEVDARYGWGVVL